MLLPQQGSQTFYNQFKEKGGMQNYDEIFVDLALRRDELEPGEGKFRQLIPSRETASNYDSSTLVHR